jgi:hypothetical protein
MASQLVVAASLALVVVILASILGAVDRRERYWFVGGVALFIVAHAVGSPGGASAVLAVVGVVAVVAATVPLLRESV